MPVVTKEHLTTSTTKRLNARAARNQFSDLVGQVHYTGEPVIIERSGKPMVVMLSVERYEQLLNEQSLPATATASDKRREEEIDDPLLGAFPELAAITDEDIAWAKALLNQGVEKQLRIIDGLEA